METTLLLTNFRVFQLERRDKGFYFNILNPHCLLELSTVKLWGICICCEQRATYCTTLTKRWGWGSCENNAKTTSLSICRGPETVWLHEMRPQTNPTLPQVAGDASALSKCIMIFNGLHSINTWGTLTEGNKGCFCKWTHRVDIQKSQFKKWLKERMS